jgi:bis(5'-adenosyl)-triphosphatase
MAYRFGPHAIRSTELFYLSKYSMGLVNLKPIVPGHLLVVSRRLVPRFTELTPDEVADLFTSAQRIARMVETEYQAESITLAVQVTRVITRHVA